MGCSCTSLQQESRIANSSQTAQQRWQGWQQTSAVPAGGGMRAALSSSHRTAEVCCECTRAEQGSWQQPWQCLLASGSFVPGQSLLLTRLWTTTIAVYASAACLAAACVFVGCPAVLPAACLLFAAHAWLRKPACCICMLLPSQAAGLLPAATHDWAAPFDWAFVETVVLQAAPARHIAEAHCCPAG